MGFFDFVKGAGEKLFGKDEAPAEAAKADPAKPEFDAAFVAAQLTRKVQGLGMPVEGLEITFADGKATVSGTVPNRATADLVVLTLGNTTIVEGVDDQLNVAVPVVVEQAEAAPPEPPAVFHTVVKGDTLWAIASKHYGKGNRYKEIFEANTPMLADANLIYPGQVLRIPGSRLMA